YEDLVAQQRAGRQVGGLGDALAPGGQLPEDRQLRARHRARSANTLPRLLRLVAHCQPRAPGTLLQRPAEQVVSLELFLELRGDGGEEADIVRRVGELLAREGALIPLREGEPLAE